jgi:hypothetical protein
MKTCKDFEYTGVECCVGCHEEVENYTSGLVTIQINGEAVYVCCEIAHFFYPDGSWKDAGQWWSDEE